MITAVAYWVCMTFGIFGLLVYVCEERPDQRPHDAIAAALFLLLALCLK